MTRSEHDGSAQGERREGGSRLPAALRQARIIASFEKDGFVSIADLSSELGVSGMTIRRDLDLLGKKGLLERTHGGAVVCRWRAAGKPARPRDVHAVDFFEALLRQGTRYSATGEKQ